MRILSSIFLYYSGLSPPIQAQNAHSQNSGEGEPPPNDQSAITAAAALVGELDLIVVVAAAALVAAAAAVHEGQAAGHSPDADPEAATAGTIIAAHQTASCLLRIQGNRFP